MFKVNSFKKYRLQLIKSSNFFIYTQSYKYSQKHPQKIDQPINHYQTLNISPDSAFDQIKRKFKQLSKVYHPDYYKGKDNKFHDIQKAYKTLSQIKTRKHHDINLGIKHSLWESQEFKLDSDKFQNQAFQHILKSQQKQFHQIKTLEQRLYAKFQKEINHEMSFKQKMKCLFWPGLSFSFIWIGWHIFEYIILNYKGSQSFNVQSHENQKKMSSVPINIR